MQKLSVLLLTALVWTSHACAQRAFFEEMPEYTIFECNDIETNKSNGYLHVYLSDSLYNTSRGNYYRFRLSHRIEEELSDEDKWYYEYLRADNKYIYTLPGGDVIIDSIMCSGDSVIYNITKDQGNPCEECKWLPLYNVKSPIYISSAVGFSASFVVLDSIQSKEDKRYFHVSLYPSRFHIIKREGHNLSSNVFTNIIYEEKEGFQEFTYEWYHGNKKTGTKCKCIPMKTGSYQVIEEK